MSTDLKQLTKDIQEHTKWIDPFVEEVGKFYIGNKDIVQELLIAILTGGNVLLEGLPGTGKSTVITLLSKIFDLKFQRIQFTPDLLPSDIIGTMIYNPGSNEFSTKKGPIFTQLLLADEINRAPSKVQSALLEAMQEHQVTIGDQTYQLPKPFFVLATQNPIEQEGTYTLPEAQIDRFMMKLNVSYPAWEAERKILDLKLSLQSVAKPQKLFSEKEIFESQQWIDAVYMDEKIKDYIVNLITATRTPAKFHMDELTPFIKYGASSRAIIALATGSKTLAFLSRRGYVTPQDVKTMSQVVLRHRIGLSYEAEAQEVTAHQILNKILETVPVP